MIKGPFDELAEALEGIVTSDPGKDEARRIADAIKNTYDKNYKWTPPKFPWVTDHRRKGYYCYQWAWGFFNAANSESNGHFRVEVRGAKDRGTGVHLWLEINSDDTGESVYGDDGFANGAFVHSEPPVPNGYNEQGSVTEVDYPRGNSRPVTAYNADGDRATKQKLPDLPDDLSWGYPGGFPG